MFVSNIPLLLPPGQCGGSHINKTELYTYLVIFLGLITPRAVVRTLQNKSLIGSRKWMRQLPSRLYLNYFPCITYATSYQIGTIYLWDRSVQMVEFIKESQKN